jgi:polysaccharide export outer membrane protein
MLPMRVLWVVLVASAFCAAQGDTIVTPNSSDHASAEIAKTSGTAPQFQKRSPRYRIEAGDVFDLSFELSPEFNQTVSVQPDGFVTLRGVGDIKVAGQSVPELTETLVRLMERS